MGINRPVSAAGERLTDMPALPTTLPMQITAP
jgi:hypothetical protein